LYNKIIILKKVRDVRNEALDTQAVAEYNNWKDNEDSLKSLADRYFARYEYQCHSVNHFATARDLRRLLGQYGLSPDNLPHVRFADVARTSLNYLDYLLYAEGTNLSHAKSHSQWLLIGFKKIGGVQLFKNCADKHGGSGRSKVDFQDAQGNRVKKMSRIQIVSFKDNQDGIPRMACLCCDKSLKAFHQLGREKISGGGYAANHNAVEKILALMYAAIIDGGGYCFFHDSYAPDEFLSYEHAHIQQNANEEEERNRGRASSSREEIEATKASYVLSCSNHHFFYDHLGPRYTTKQYVQQRRDEILSSSTYQNYVAEALTVLATCRSSRGRGVGGGAATALGAAAATAVAAAAAGGGGDSRELQTFFILLIIFSFYNSSSFFL
jgi:hypothetical protein